MPPEEGLADGLEALANIEVPVPSIEKQRWFTQMHTMAEHLLMEQQRIGSLYDVLIPAILERAFRAPSQLSEHDSEHLCCARLTQTKAISVHSGFRPEPFFT